MAPAITLHVLTISHPCLAARAAAERKGLDAEIVTLNPGEHNAVIEEIYGEGRTTVPGMVVDGEPVHGTTAIMERLEVLAPDGPSLYPEPISGRVREAQQWADAEVQDLGRRLTWGALHFRPEAMGTFAGGGPLDPAGTDFAIGYARSSWKYHRITAVQLAEDLAGLPAKVEHIDALAADGIVGGDEPTAADFEIGATVRVLLTIGDLRPLLENRAAGTIARRWFADYPGDVPAGAYPAGWVPAPAG